MQYFYKLLYRISNNLTTKNLYVYVCKYCNSPRSSPLPNDCSSYELKCCCQELYAFNDRAETSDSVKGNATCILVPSLTHELLVQTPVVMETRNPHHKPASHTEHERIQNRSPVEHGAVSVVVRSLQRRISLGRSNQRGRDERDTRNRWKVRKFVTIKSKNV